MGGILWQTTRNGGRTARKAVDMAPSMRCLRENAHHVVSGDAIGARDYRCEATQGLWVHGEAMIDADITDLVYFLCHCG